MYKDKKDFIATLIADVPNNRVAYNLSDLLLHDADVDQYDSSMRLKMASAIDDMLGSGDIEDVKISDELKDWSNALKDLEAGAREFDEAAELARRAGL